MKARRDGRCFLIGLTLLASVAAAQENPHQMTLPDGSTDAGKCAYCHNDDLTLSRSHADTCTLCHAETVHSGAAEHARARADAVGRALEGKDTPALPLAADGRMYCGTCHLFHDPAVMGEPLLANGRAARDEPINRAVREGVLTRAEAAGGSGEIEFAERGTRYLRLPVDDDGLCSHCHGDY